MLRLAYISLIGFCLLMTSDVGLLAAPVPGEHFQPFSAAKSDGGTMDWKPGRTTVLSFCAFWCDTWKEQSRRLARCSKAAAHLPVDFITVSVDGRWSERCAGKITGMLLLDLKSTIARRLKINRIPSTFVVDTNGVVRYAAEGIVREAAVNDSVRMCLGEDRSEKAGVIYLTFDDFPCSREAASTVPGSDPDERLLDVLKANGVQATFFCICNRLSDADGLVDRAVGDGHSLQVHSWDHQGSDRVEQCVEVIEKLTGTSPSLYRPPGTEKCEAIKGSRTMTCPVVDPYDYTRPGKEELRRRILLAAKPGCVVLLHAGVSETIDVIPEVISALRQRGCQFDVLR